VAARRRGVVCRETRLNLDRKSAGRAGFPSELPAARVVQPARAAGLQCGSRPVIEMHAGRRGRPVHCQGAIHVHALN